MLKNLKSKGITIVVATPYMDEANLCERVALIKDGEILQVNTPQEIVDQFERKLYAIKSNDNYQCLLDLREFEFTNSVFLFGQALHYTDARKEFSLEEVNSYLKSKGHLHLEIEQVKPGIEDCFMALSTKTDGYE
jgi:ABC-type multidrug transport system ATPase subunit